ncbi:MAG: protein-disulfide reductase DsbD domain-containing protein, partial [Thermoanaerobaculia bacterium]
LEGLAEKLVRVTARLSSPLQEDGWQPFEIGLEIQEAWHLNANPASLDYLIPTKLEGKVRGLSYPQGESFKFAFAPEKLSVYSGLVTIGGEIAPGEQTLSLTYQACDDRRCLPPVTKKVTLPKH